MSKRRITVPEGHTAVVLPNAAARSLASGLMIVSEAVRVSNVNNKPIVLTFTSTAQYRVMQDTAIAIVTDLTTRGDPL